MQCRAVLTRIDARRTGELEEKEQSQMEAHLETCRSCLDSVSDIEGLAHAAKALVSKPPRSCLKKLHGEVQDWYAEVTSGNDRVWVAFNDRGITMISLASNSPEDFQKKYCARYGHDLLPADLPKEYRQQVLDALAGHPQRNPTVDLSAMTEFERSVLRTIARIPVGSVRPYNWVAEQIHRPRAVRAVGNVLAQNPVPLLMPCHRVVPASGGLGNYGYGVARKRDLLTREGVPVEDLERKTAGRRA